MLKMDQKLFARAIEVLGNEQDALHWLQTPRSALNNQIPLKYIETDEGQQEVLDLLGRIEHGVFS
jgi:putative toxin-antitoxin system antitoxin component (TIGR02293 family)|tara:strand:+ start:28612 stop:28806 length:195 start_codon:yes stop_codon:yes gene_type:complete